VVGSAIVCGLDNLVSQPPSPLYLPPLPLTVLAMDCIDGIASVGAGEEAENDARAEIDAYEAGTLGICGELEESGTDGSDTESRTDGSDTELVQQHISELSEAVISSTTAKTYARYSRPVLSLMPLHVLSIDCGTT
jgi:hypothetical protein